VEHLTRGDAPERLPQWLQGAFEHFELPARRDDDNYPNSECRQLLLVLHTAVGGEQHIEVTRSAPQQFAVFVSAPAFFLDSPDLELGQAAPK
jgi:hypothetical protein